MPARLQPGQLHQQGAEAGKQEDGEQERETHARHSMVCTSM